MVSLPSERSAFENSAKADRILFPVWAVATVAAPANMLVNVPVVTLKLASFPYIERRCSVQRFSEANAREDIALFLSAVQVASLPVATGFFMQAAVIMFSLIKAFFMSE
ncbi:hypothetical protein D8779_13410 [Pseudomonas leptonychotis]|uniref:Uncharacterized protein n=1 Tax=Pseudomonas leptonychotis TaxID=2448482 RepID=A0A4T2A051_9PSED|nr:hypothetical protein D8779_13410 [Pseudomonas leptonychotis]